MELLFSAFGLLLYAIVIVVIYRRLRHHPEEDGRTARLRPLAAKMSLEFTEKGEPVYLSALHPFAVFRIGEQVRFRNLMYGVIQEVEVAVFDLFFDPLESDGDSGRSLTVCSFHVIGLRLPHFELRPKNPRKDCLASFQHKDLAPVARPWFSQRYLLGGEPEEAVRAFFDDHVLE
jgi:hypothetical protein